MANKYLTYDGKLLMIDGKFIEGDFSSTPSTADTVSLAINTTDTPTEYATNIKVGDSAFKLVSNLSDLTGNNFKYTHFNNVDIIESVESSSSVNTCANIKKSIVFGQNNTIDSKALDPIKYSLILGKRNNVGGSAMEGSITAGSYLKNSYTNKTVIGIDNVEKKDTYFEVGCNTKNGFEVYKDGHAEVYITGTTDNSVTNKKYVDDAIASAITTALNKGV